MSEAVVPIPREEDDDAVRRRKNFTFMALLLRRRGARSLGDLQLLLRDLQERHTMGKVHYSIVA